MIKNTCLMSCFIDNSDLYAVTMPINLALSSKLALRLKERGVMVYAHTVNSKGLVRLLKKRGVSGYYTDLNFFMLVKLII